MGRNGITEVDVHQMLAITRDYPGDDDGEALPWELLHDLKALVPCDMVSVSGQDTMRWEVFADQELPPDPVSDPDALNAAYREHYWSSFCSLPDRAGDRVPVARLSDEMTDGEYHRCGMYSDFLKVVGVERLLMAWLDAGGPMRTVRLLFFRGPGLDFSDREVAMLRLLHPHLRVAYAAAERRRRGDLPLTARQREILRFVAAGQSNRQIARQVRISEDTVRKHLENIFARLDVTSRTAAVARASSLL